MLVLSLFTLLLAGSLLTGLEARLLLQGASANASATALAHSLTSGQASAFAQATAHYPAAAVPKPVLPPRHWHRSLGKAKQEQ